MLAWIVIWFEAFIPEYFFAGGQDIRTGVVIFYPSAILFLAGLAAWLFSATAKSESHKGGWRRFVLWLLMKLGLIGIIVSFFFFGIGGVKFLLSKF